MRADAANFVRFLRNSDQIRVPIYQRTFSWTTDECEQLFTDVLRVAEADDETGHFIGSIVYVAENLFTVASGNSVQVIDGQQRLTTLSLLLVALRAAFRQEDPDHAEARRIRNTLLLRPDESDDARYKLVLTQRDRETLFALVDDRPLPDEPSRAIIDALDHFGSALRRPGITPALVLRGIERLIIVDISLDRGRDDPQLIFESLNSTGVDLTQADLIRNFLLMDLREPEQRRVYQDSWYPMERALSHGDDTGLFDRFVRDYLTLKTGQIVRLDRVYAAYKSFVRSSGRPPAEAAASDLRRFAGYYAQLVYARHDDPGAARALGDLARLDVAGTYPFMLDVLDDRAEGKIDNRVLERVIRTVETYLFRRSVCGVPQAAVNKIFATLAREIDEDRYVESLYAALLLRESTSRFPSDEEFRQQLTVRDVYNYRHRTYLLSHLENHGRREAVDVEAFTIEHVMPQNAEVPRAWRDELGEEWERVHETYLHTLGNLSLTGYNSELSDRPFAVKQTLPGGFRQSPLWLNSSLAHLEHWDEAAIRERAAILADRALEVWARPPIDGPTLQRYREARGVTRATYTLADHPHLVGGVSDVYEALRRRVLNLDPDLREDVRKQYIGFRTTSTIVSVVPLSGELKVYLRATMEELDDPDGRLRDVTRIGHWGVGDVETRVATTDDVDAVMKLVEQVHARHADDPEPEAAWAEAAVERVIETFPDAAMQGSLRRLVETATDLGLHPRPYKQALMLAPAANRSRALCTLRRRDDADADFYVAVDAFADFFGLDAASVAAHLGDRSGGERVTAGQVSRIAEALDELLAGAEGVEPPTKWRERHGLRHKFWTDLLERAKSRTALHGSIAPTPYHWLGTGAGWSGLSYNYSVTQHRWKVELYIDLGREAGADNLRVFEALRAEAPAIEAAFGGSLLWEPLEGRRACRISYSGDGGYRDSDRWGESHERMIDAMTRLHQALAPRLALARAAGGGDGLVTDPD